jgi:hypothetical protein
VFFPDQTRADLFCLTDMTKLQLNILQEEDNGVNLIALYDGAPEIKPECRMICFTSYDASWFSAGHDMTGIHATLYMSTWSLSELEDARTALKLNITDQTLSENFYRFGGIPRICFLDPASVEYKHFKTLLDQGIQRIQSFEHFIQMLANLDNCLFQFVHVLDHINFFLDSYFEPTSSLVESAISKHLQARNHNERVEMLLKLEGVSRASSFFVFLFEPHVHFKCVRLKIHLLASWNSHLIFLVFQIPETTYFLNLFLIEMRSI